ncbi:PBP1A family penicillin-binding protein [Sneathia vaginalis]|uniref:transglycosylase domain-containing protein n=2 Tax=Sneathia TaxID=168808 RepID=UPI00254A8C19|nr:PBP1A family penicillin-binding protein [Sneathia vaginalis]MDK9582178.1 PBP1A family penicillin-binding protein [Sneathia vaginalis]
MLENYEPLKPSVIYDINGKQIDVLAIENRDPIAITEVPKVVQNAFIAVEDKRFRKHHGIDLIRSTKALILNVTKTGRQGGSTITQQLVKNAFLTSERTFKRKITEAILAIEMERIYTKDEILEYYLNTINFGRGAYGIKNGSLKYFGVLPKDLTIAQAAILASIPKSPSKYSQLKNALDRQKIVLESMYTGGFITKDEYNKALKEKITFITPKEMEKRSETQEISNSNVSPEVTTVVLNEMKKILHIDDDDIKSLFNGYKIYSTVDIDMQKAAYKAFEANANLKKRANLQGALISMDTTNGFVKAMVGGKNYVKGDFNRAIYAKRQPGSSFKPVAYLAALQKGIPMNTVLEDSPTMFGKWTPKNYDLKYRSNMTMLKALEVSNNVAAVKVLDLAGIDNAKKVWLDSGVTSEHFPNDLTLALGSITTTPLDMLRFYSALSNGGYKVEPQFIYKIENRYGEVIYEADTKKTKIYEPEDVALITFMLQQVIEHGTGQSAKLYKNGKLIPVAGKTGTTSDYVSAWFTGYTPTLATVVYVGNDDNKTMGKGMSGSAAAIPLWKNYMQAVINLPSYNVGNFDYIINGMLQGKLEQYNIDLLNGMLDVDGVNVSPALFKAGSAPLEFESLNNFEY